MFRMGGLLFVVMLFVTLIACQKSDTVLQAENVSMELKASPSRLVTEEATLDYSAFVEAVKNDPNAPQVLFDSSMEEFEPEVWDYLHQMWSEVMDDGPEFAVLPTTWMCFKKMFNDNPDDDCPVREKPEND